jgi:hypothetical protein
MNSEPVEGSTSAANNDTGKMSAISINTNFFILVNF